MPNGKEKEQARKVIANAQQEAQRVARLENAVGVAGAKIESYRRVMFAMIMSSAGKEIKVSEELINRINAMSWDEAKNAVFEVDADTEPGTIIYRIPSAETLEATGRVKSMMEHVDEGQERREAEGTPAPAALPLGAMEEVRDEVEGADPLPTAEPVPDQPGFVYSPFLTGQTPIDVRGFCTGQKVRDPHSNKIFILP